MKFWAFFFQVVWVLLFFGIAIGTSYGCHDHELWLISIIAIIPVLDIIWFAISSKRNKTMGAVNAIGNAIVLNIPAYIFISKFFINKDEIEAKKEAKNSIYKKQDAPKYIEKEADYDFDLADWEKEILKQRKPKEYKQLVEQEKAENVDNIEVTITRKIIRGFSVFVMYKIYEKEPQIVNTYNIIQQYKNLVTTPSSRKELINEFSKQKHLKEYIEDYNANVMNAKRISDELNNTSPEEFLVAFNQDRVDIIIDAKNAFYNDYPEQFEIAKKIEKQRELKEQEIIDSTITNPVDIKPTYQKQKPLELTDKQEEKIQEEFLSTVPDKNKEAVQSLLDKGFTIDQIKSEFAVLLETPTNNTKKSTK